MGGKKNILNARPSKKFPVSLIIATAVLTWAVSWATLIIWPTYYHDPRPICKISRWNKRIVEYSPRLEGSSSSKVYETRRFVVESEDHTGFDYPRYKATHSEDVVYFLENSDPERPNRLVIFTDYSYLDKNFLRYNQPKKERK